MKKYIISILLVITTLVFNVSNVYGASTEEDFVYLSDIPYIEDKSFAETGHKIKLDENNDDKTIILNVDGTEKPFIKGVSTWATSEIVYDLSNYNFDYFTSYLGVDASEKNTYFNTGVKFYIYLSTDGENWGEPVETTDTIDASKPAKFVKIDIKNANYLKLVADDNSDSWWSTWYDEAVYANAKLIKETYTEDTSTIDFIKTTQEYDEIIKNNYSNNNEISGEYELTLLKREFVNNVGYDTLQAFAKVSDDYQNILKWLMNDTENLRLYLIGGTPDGSYVNSLRVLNELYNTYKNDLNNESLTTTGIKLKDLYKKMIITLSLTHSADVGLWVTGTSGNPDGANDSNAVDRYAIFKNLHSSGLLDSKIFESLEIEEMRFVMNNIIDDEEIEWLNAYSREKNSKDPYSYITYGFGYDYYKSEYYDQNNYTMWDNKYNLSKYNLTYAQNLPKLWVVFEEGGVCGAISKTGSNLQGVYGIPSSVVGQPGHAAYIYYSLNANGDGIWNLYNDVSGWAESSRTEKLGIRMPNGWGIGTYASEYPVTYILLAQANLNDFTNYKESEEILMLANTYATNNSELYKIYRNALKVNPLNFDAWLNLVNLYIVDDTKNESDYIKLATEIADTLKYYPLPMYDLLRLIESNITSDEGLVQFTLLRKNALTAASAATSDLSIQDFAVRQVANYLLGNTDSNIATFSFDGEEANTIMLSEDKFGTSGVVWEYSLDGKKTWIQTTNHKHLLTEQEINSINAENDINIHIVGTNYDDANIYTIDITKASLPTNLYNNDYENKVIGNTANLEWRFNESDSWTSFNEKLPDLTGNKAITIRVSSTGTSLFSDSNTLHFTEDVSEDTYKYISIDRLSIANVSTEETSRNEGAINAIDGNINTMWHTLWNGSDNEKYITIKLDEKTYISGIEYFQRQDGSNNGKVTNAKILVSEDGENWTEVIPSTEWNLTNAPQKVVFSEAVYAQYIKIIGVTTSGSYMSAAMINVYEDITKNQETPNPEEPTPDPEEPTPDPEEPTPDPEEPTPDPEEPTPDPEEPTPDPEEPTPEPEEPIPSPEEPTPEPEEPTPTPEESTPEKDPEEDKTLDTTTPENSKPSNENNLSNSSSASSSDKENKTEENSKENTSPKKEEQTSTNESVDLDEKVDKDSNNDVNQNPENTDDNPTDNNLDEDKGDKNTNTNHQDQTTEKTTEETHNYTFLIIVVALVGTCGIILWILKHKYNKNNLS